MPTCGAKYRVIADLLRHFMRDYGNTHDNPYMS
jgi:hypothetical protein